MKISPRDIKLLIALPGILILVCIYFLVYQPLGEKTPKLEAENTTLQQRVSELQAWKQQEAFFEEEIARMETENKEILNKFPADVRDEDAIMLATDLGNASPAEIISVSIEEPEDLYHVGQFASEQAATQTAQAAENQSTATQTADAATQPATVTPVNPTAATEQATAAMQILYGRKVQINYKCNYDELKRSIKYLYDSTDRRIVGAIGATYDTSTGLLDVSLGTGLYYLTGTEREYVEPNIPFIPQGTDNIFGTLTIPSVQPAQQGDE